MRRTLQQLLKDNSGAVLIYVALAIFALAAIGILGVDVSRMLVARVQLQNAADAGALAGARLFIDGPNPSDVDIVVEAKDIAGMNKAFAEEGAELIPRDNIDVVVRMEDQWVGVTTRSVVSQYFLGVARFAENSGEVSAFAAARYNEVCDNICMKPWSIPDRWDDFTQIADYDEWVGNGLYNQEDFTDQDDDKLYNSPEPFDDANGNGIHDGEFYDPLITGYTAAKDLGLQLTLKANNGSKPEPSQYWPIDLPDENGDRVPGGAQYRWNIANCNPNTVNPGDYLWTENGNMIGPTKQGMQKLIDQDPNAKWDTECTCIVDGDPQFSISPRVGLIPIHDPRIPMQSGKKTVLVTKIAAFFIEEQRGDGTVVGRFLRIQGPGTPCPEGQTAGGFIWNLSLVE